jgi:carboxylate-amine ligase
MLLALSASSPFLRGEDNGLASNRTILFQGFPRTGMPRRFADYEDWVSTVNLLLRSRAIPEPTFLWWDVRPQPRLGTVEVRIMDSQPQLEATAALAALVQALARLELEQGYAAPELIAAQEVLSENRFLAARDGAAAQLIDPVRGRMVPIATQLGDLLVALRPHAQALGSTREIARASHLGVAPEISHQRELAAKGGVEAIVRDLAGRFTGRAETTAPSRTRR